MATSTNVAELMAISANGSENLVPAAEERRQSSSVHKFLSLAPTTSASYPTVKSPTPKSPVQKAVVQADVATTDAAIPALPVESAEHKTRRSSSLSSNGSLMSKRRFLKLGPVHFGEGDGDWSEEVIN